MAASWSAASLLASRPSSARYAAGLSPGGSFGTHLGPQRSASQNPFNGNGASSGQDDAAYRDHANVQPL